MVSILFQLTFNKNKHSSLILCYNKNKLFKKACLTEVGCCLLTENTEAIVKLCHECDLLNDTPNSSSSPRIYASDDGDELGVSF